MNNHAEKACATCASLNPITAVKCSACDNLFVEGPARRVN